MTTQERELEQIARGRRPATWQEAERAGRTTWQSGDSTAKTIRLWDNVDGTWTGGIEQGIAMAHYLRKVVFKCTACMFTDIYEGRVADHIKGVAERYRQHLKAGLEPVFGKEPSKQCMGCNQVFLTRKNSADKHLEQMVAEGPAHKGAQETIMRRFSLAPSTPVANSTGPVDIQVERSGRKRSRHRKRRRNR